MMRPTSERDSDSRAHTDAEDRPPVQDSSAAEPGRGDPWASGPAHLAQDEQTERLVPEQRSADHEGHLYASDSYAEPEAEGSHADVAQAHGEAARAHDDAAVARDDAARARNAAVPADTAHVPGGTADTMDGAPDKTDGKRDDAADENVGHDDARDGQATSVVDADRHDDQPAAVGVAHVDPDHTIVAGPADEGPTAVVTDETRDETPGHTPDETPADSSAELKPGDVPVAAVTGFLSADAAQGLRDRWRDAQLGFVDDPRRAVEDVRSLVDEAVDQFTAALHSQRDKLNASSGEDTEQYRVAVQRYRIFFERLMDL